MPSTCEFNLNSPNDVYYSGQIVSGSITLNTTSEKNIRNISIRFLGEAKVNWTESERHRRHDGKYETRTVYFKANEVYIDNATCVRGDGVLPPGTYTYTFNIPLPMSCPTSCEGTYGHIRYSLWLTVDRPFRFDNEFSKPLTVLRTVDLNLNPAFRVPIQSEDVSSVGCWPCASGTITYVLTVPFGAYAPGQTLKYTLLVQNQSMTDIDGYEVEFYENIQFTAHTPRRKERKTNIVLARQKHSDSCLRLTNRQFEGEIELPSMPPDTEGHGIIRVRHSLDIEIKVEGCHSNNNISIPIVIGTVPVRESVMMMMPQDDRFTENVPSAPLLPPSPNVNNGFGLDLPPSYGDFKPPSFEEATRSHSPFQDPDANEHNNAIGFRPMYPMYPEPKEKQ